MNLWRKVLDIIRATAPPLYEPVPLSVRGDFDVSMNRHELALVIGSLHVCAGDLLKGAAATERMGVSGYPMTEAAAEMRGLEAKLRAMVGLGQPGSSVRPQHSEQPQQRDQGHYDPNDRDNLVWNAQAERG